MKIASILLVITLLISADLVIAAENDEIDYRLAYIADSCCTFIRNGGEHSSKEASEHLEMKYNSVRRYIKTAEDFIEKIGSKSSFTRTHYEVRCEEVTLPAGQWLKGILISYRTSKH